ncbi:hypothetical protein ACJ41O_013098 [Fusarium nematophilum]
MSQQKSMRAVVFKGVGSVQVEGRQIPTIHDPGDAIVKVCVAALCGSDLHGYRGHQKIPAGFIPGHEFAGVVHELGSQGKGLKVDDSVVVSSSCFNYLSLVLSAGTTSIDGGQAEYVRVPYASSTLIPRPTEIPEDMLVLMGDIFPTGYFCASRFLKSLPKEEARSSCTVVVGCGPVGICAIAAATKWCDNIFAVDMAS